MIILDDSKKNVETKAASYTSPNDSNGVATSLAVFRHVLPTTHLFTTNHCEGLDRMGGPEPGLGGM